MSKLSKVALVGRMNVGKSTLFNKLSTSVRSMALDYEGVTRDYLKDQVEWAGVFFQLYDTGGIENFKKSDDIIQQKVQQKVIALLKEVDVIIFMVDGTVGLVPHDRWIAQELHKLSKPVILVVNKIDNKATAENFHEFYALGFKNIIGISAEHRTGTNELLDKVVELLPKKSQDITIEKPGCKVVFLGKPNVGKSSLLNAILNQERAIVSEQAGTTREALSETIKFYQEDIQITDTPGIRRKRSVGGELEPLMVKSSFSALKDSDIVVLLMDGSEGEIVDQELKLAFYAFTEQYKALILLVNKEDLMTDKNRADLEFSLDYYKHLIHKKVPLMNISCKTGKNIGKILPLITEVYKRYSYQFNSEELRMLFATELQKKHLIRAKQRLKVYEVEQVRTAPITIAIKVNLPVFFEESQLAFLENIMRSNYDLVGVPIKFLIRSTKDKLNKSSASDNSESENQEE